MLDLSKLKALELPKKEITVEILGEKQSLEITAFGDDVSLDISDIVENNKDSAEKKSRLHLLKNCAGLSEVDALCLLKNDGGAASAIIKEIFSLTEDFRKEREKIREQAEKNLQMAQGVITPT